MERISHSLDPKIRGKVRLRDGSEPFPLLFQYHQDEIISCKYVKESLLASILYQEIYYYRKLTADFQYIPIEYCIHHKTEYLLSRCEKRMYLLTHVHSIPQSIDDDDDDAAAAAAATSCLVNMYPTSETSIVLYMTSESWETKGMGILTTDFTIAVAKI
jgi:hypothetical protein